MVLLGDGIIAAALQSDLMPAGRAVIPEGKVSLGRSRSQGMERESDAAASSRGDGSFAIVCLHEIRGVFACYSPTRDLYFGGARIDQTLCLGRALTNWG